MYVWHVHPTHSSCLSQTQASSRKASASLEELKHSKKVSLTGLLEDENQEDENGATILAHSGGSQSRSKSVLLATERLRTMLGLWMDGSTVVTVNAGSAAEGKVMVGDKIVQIDNHRVSPEQMLVRLALASIPNARLQLTVERSGPDSLAVEEDVVLTVGTQLQGIYSREDGTRREVRGMLRADDGVQMRSSTSPQVHSTAQDFLSSLTRFNTSLVKAGVSAAAASPTPEPRLQHRSKSPAVENGWSSDGGHASLHTTGNRSMRKMVEEVFEQYEKTDGLGGLTVSQAAIVASVLHQKLFTGVERSSQALTSALQLKLHQHYDRRRVDLDSFYAWYLKEVSDSAVASP